MSNSDGTQEHLASNDGIESQDQPSSIGERSLQAMLNGLSNMPLERGMYRVPKGLRTTNENAYTPRLISIGPLHHGKESLRELEEQKLIYLKAFLTWSDMSLDSLKQFMKKKEDRLKRFYTADTIEKFRGDLFAELILVDATFIVVLLLRTFSRDKLLKETDKLLEVRDQLWKDSTSFRDRFGGRNDYIFETSYVEAQIRRDLALLENQIPFFILLDLYDKIQDRKKLSCSFSIVALRFLNEVSLNKTEISDEIEITSLDDPEGKVKHLVDMLRIRHKPSKPRMDPQKSEFSEIQFRSVTELYESGVKLKLSTSKNCLDIHYSDGNLEIPHLKFTDFALVFGNMVAFEQCYCLDERNITDYVNLMARLVTSTEDVKLLIQHGILSNKLANKQAVEIFCDLGRESLFQIDKFYYRRLCEDLDEYCKVGWHKWRALLTHEYSKNPFTVITTFLHFVITILDLAERRTVVLEFLNQFPVTKYILLFVLGMASLLRQKSFRNPWTTSSVAAVFLLLAVYLGSGIRRMVI